MSVYRAIYEVVGGNAALALVRHRAAVQGFQERAYAIAKAYGGQGFRPAHSGGLQSIIFNGDLVPSGFKLDRRDKAANYLKPSDLQRICGQCSAGCYPRCRCRHPERRRMLQGHSFDRMVHEAPHRVLAKLTQFSSNPPAQQ